MSQFTLLAKTPRGRPDFHGAMASAAEPFTVVDLYTESFAAHGARARNVRDFLETSRRVIPAAKHQRSEQDTNFPLRFSETMHC